jgi:choline dehydrogenase
MADRYDEIIVGAGSSGAALAARLTEDPARRVLLVEAGPDYRDDEVPAEVKLGTTPLMTGSHDWGYQARAGKGDREIAYFRGKVTGGSSAINTAIALRGTPADFEKWVSFGLPSWSWEDVLPYYVALEDDPEGEGPDHGKDGPIPVRRNTFGPLRPVQQAFQDACNELGYPTVADLNSGELDPQGSVGKLPMYVVDDVRMSTALTYLSAARGRPNLTIVADRTVDRVLIENGAATGIVVRHHGREERYEAARVTLSAGAFGTPAILMRSGIGSRALLSALGIDVVADLAGVGENLMDHPTSALALTPKPGVCNAEDPLVQVMLRYTSSGSSDINDMQLYFLSNVDLGGGWSTEAGELAGASLSPILNPGLQKPRSRGSVTLTSADPEAAPKIELRFLDDDEDRHKLIEGMRVSAKLAAAGPIAHLIDGMVGLTPEAMESDDAVSEYLEATVTTILHASGTARMGRADDPMAVVDERFGVHGVANLRVVDASVMPEIVRANTNLTCIMLAERAATM